MDVESPYAQAQQHIFDSIKPILKQYQHLDADELMDVCVARIWSIAQEAGTAHLFTDAWVQHKAHKWSSWWVDQRKKGMGRYTPQQRQVGHAKGLITRRRRATNKAWICHSLRQQGGSYRWIARRMGIALGSVARYLKEAYAAVKKRFMRQQSTRYTINHTCGHSSTRQLMYGKASKREWIVEQEGQRLCPECVAKVSDLKGTPKQVAWAERIRAQALTGLSHSIVLAALRRLNEKKEGIDVQARLKNLYPEDTVSREDAMESMVYVCGASLESIAEAKMWIERRHDIESILVDILRRHLTQAAKDTHERQ